MRGGQAGSNRRSVVVSVQPVCRGPLSPPALRKNGGGRQFLTGLKYANSILISTREQGHLENGPPTPRHQVCKM